MNWLLPASAGIAGLGAGAAANRLVAAELRRFGGPPMIVLTAVFFIACAIVIGPQVKLLVLLPSCAVLVALVAVDLESRIVPNRIVVPACVAVLVAQTALQPSLRWVVAAIGAGAFFAVPALLHPAGVGMGDAKLAAFLGAVLGAPVALAITVAAFAALPVALVVLARRGNRGLTVALPFAPFLGFGALVALFVS